MASLGMSASVNVPLGGCRGGFSGAWGIGGKSPVESELLELGVHAKPDGLEAPLVSAPLVEDGPEP